MKLRKIPSIHSLLAKSEYKVLIKQYSRPLVKNTLRSILEEIRDNPDCYSQSDVGCNQLLKHAQLHLEKQFQQSLRRVINATGTVLHTNLGRAILAKKALNAVYDISSGYSNLEYNLDTGKRGQRTSHVSKLLCELTGAEAAFVTNNNAGAVLLVLTALAKDREVIVSRGELIEIGGKFRIPDVMEMSGASLVEVGTTNRTHFSDYEKAITENTALLFKAHRSNFKVMGFTKDVSIQELVLLGEKSTLPVVYDLGSGSMVDGSRFGWHAPKVNESIQSGIDIVTFSGDKLLGGPQAGIILGRKKLINQLSSHPLARALRIDKLTLAALESTLNLYQDPETVWKHIPILKVLSLSVSTLKKRAQQFLEQLQEFRSDKFSIHIAKDSAPIGGGALPLVELPTWIIKIKAKSFSSQELLTQFRKHSTPVICRLQKDQCILDFRTISATEEKEIIAAIKQIFMLDE